MVKTGIGGPPELFQQIVCQWMGFPVSQNVLRGIGNRRRARRIVLM